MLKISVKRSYAFLICSLAVITVAASLFGLYHIIRPDNNAKASLAGFDRGNIISDFVMGNKNTMSETDINNFLHSKNSCNDRDWNKYQYYTARGYQYTWKDGHFVCMADEDFGGQSIAHIIYRAAQDYSINPQVLITLLQKEQGLVTDTFPNHDQYAKATGFGCPDTGNGCDPIYGGMEAQIRKAAQLYREVLDGGWSNYPAYTTQYIQYTPDRQCGGTNVYIANRATSALYRYTPYTPNDAVLSVSPGTEVNCGAYGNTNFYHWFTSWFGSTQVSVPKSNIVLPDDDYTIKSSTDLGKVVDLDSGSHDDNAKIQLWDYIDSSDGQKYNLHYENGFYTIINKKTRKAIGIDNRSSSIGAKIVQTSAVDDCSTKWILTLDNGLYSIKSACSGLAMDVPNGSASNGNWIQMWDSNNSNAQKWQISSRQADHINDDYYYIKNASSNKVIDVDSGSHADGARVQVWDRNDTINTQKFRLERQSDGLYKIININSGKVLDLSNGNTNDGTTIQTWGYNPSVCAQRWNIRKAKDDIYTIYSSCGTNNVIDIDGGQYNTNGAKLHIWSYGDFQSQQFVFIKTSPTIPNGTYTISPSNNSGFAIDIIGGSTNSNERLHLWSKQSGLRSQQFNVQLQDDGFYSIQNVNSWLFMSVMNSDYREGVELTQRLGDGSCSQKWNIYKYSNGYEIVNPCSNLAIDLANGQAGDDQKIQIWGRNSTAAQRWTFNHL